MMYIHKVTNQKVTIKKLDGSGIAVCNLIDEPKEYNVKGELVYPVIITRMENLSPASITIRIGTQLGMNI